MRKLNKCVAPAFQFLRVLPHAAMTDGPEKITPREG